MRRSMAKAKNPGRRPMGSKTAPAGQTVAVDSAPAKPRVSPIQFFQQVQAEGKKIVWPSRKETWITSVMVFIMVILAAIFFWIVDFILAEGAQRVLAIGQ